MINLNSLRVKFYFVSALLLELLKNLTSSNPNYFDRVLK